MTNYWHHPNFDPVLFHLWGPLQIRWYSLLYVGGFLVGRMILKRLAREKRFLFTPDDMEQLVMWLLLGAVIGARIIYCFVYSPGELMRNPLFLFQIWGGGLSFHGGLIGLMVAAWLFGRKKGIPFWNLTDAMSLAGPSGLAMGRMGNFINAELYGRVTDVPWAMIFPHTDGRPRHPSQVYEFFLEGIFLVILLWMAKKHLKKDGQLSVLFLVGYSLARFIAEFFREPDAQVGYLALGFSMGQWLSLIMLAASLLLGVFLHVKVWSKEPTKKTKSSRRNA